MKKKIKKREIIEAQENEIAELEEIIEAQENEIAELEEIISREREETRDLAEEVREHKHSIEDREKRIGNLLYELKEHQKSELKTKIGWLIVGLIIAIIGWLVIPPFAEYCTYAFLSDAECRYENFFESGDNDNQHLFHLEKYLKVNGVKIDSIKIEDEEDATDIYVYGEKDKHKITIHGRTNWRDTVYDWAPYSDDWVPYERNTGEASLEASSSEYSFMHGVSWTLGYEWDLRDDDFIQDLDTGMLLPRKLLEDLDSVLANDKFASYSKGPFEDIENSYYKIKLNGEEVKEYVHD